MSDPDDIFVELADDAVSKKKRSGCLISALLFFFVFVPLALLILNGPGFRYLARLAGIRVAESRGLSGDFTIRGNLWSGFTLNGVNFSGGNGETTSLTIEEFAVGYRAFDLIRNTAQLNWLDTVRIQKARLDLYLPEAGATGEKTSKPKETPSAKPATATAFSPLWNLLAADIRIDDLTVFIHQGKSTFAIENLTLSTPRRENGKLLIGKLAIPGQSPVETVAADFSRTDHELSLGPLPLLNYARLEKLTLSEPTPGEWSVNALIGAGEGYLNASFNAPGDLVVGLRNGSRIALDKLVLPLRDGAASKLRGSVTDLDLRFSGDFTKPATWKINGKLIAANAGWGDRGADTVVMLLKDNRLDLEAARHRSTLRVTASAPLEAADSVKSLASLPLDLGVRLDVPAIEEMVADFRNPPPLTGTFSLEARDIQLKGGKTIQSGSLLLLSDNLAWDGIQLSGGQVAANVESENLIRLAAEAGLDAANHLRVSGSLDARKLTYEAVADIALDTAGRLGQVLADREGTRLSGTAAMEWKGSGGLRERHHTGETLISLRSVIVGGGQPVDGSLAARYEGALAVLEKFSLSAGGVALTGTGEWDGKVVSLPDWRLSREDRVPLTLQASLPFQLKTGSGFLASTGPLSLNLKMEDLALEEVTRFFAKTPPAAGKVRGDLTGGGSFDRIDLDGHLEFRPDQKPAEPVGAPRETANPAPVLTVDLGLKGNIQKPSTWEARLDALAAGLHWKGMAVENLSLKTATDLTQPGHPLIAELWFDQSETTLDASARLDLGGAETFSDLKSRQLKLDADLAVGSFEALLRDFAPDNLKGLPLSGGLTAKITDFTLKNGSLTGGEVAVDSGSFSVEDQPFESFTINAGIPEADLLKAVLTVGLDEKNQIKADGGFHLKDRTYEGRISLNTDLKSEGSKLRKLLKGRAVADLLPALSVLNWEGHGNFRESDHAGDLALRADGVTLAEGAEPLDLNFEGTYTGTSADFPAVQIASRPIRLNGALRWENKVLKLVDWSGQSDSREVLTLAGDIPLDREKLSASQWFAQDSPLALQLKLDKLPVETLSRLFRKEAPVRGALSLNLTASGSPATPGLAADLLFDQIAVPRDKESLAAGRLELSLESAGDTLSLNGSYRHPEIKPLGIKAALPFHPGSWAVGKRIMTDEPLTASATMERSSLAFLAGQVPGIESIAGEIALNAEIKGSLSKPQLSGEGLLDVERLRLENRNAPSLHDIDLVARFAENRIVLEKLNAIVAGGTVEGSGEALFKPGEEPFIKLALKGSEVLVIRNADVNVRTDLALTLTGPWSKATLNGELGITNSRFFKNFDLLPFGFPTRSTSVLPTIEHAPGGGGPSVPDLNVGVDIAPFRDWGVNLRVHTKDPFLIRSNLVESAIVADLNVKGTLGRPVPVGYVAIDKGELSLPFSEVDVETGRVEFDESTGFNGAIEFKAKGKADRYQISIYLFNRLLSPQYVLTSIPPLPSEDIITLLATGTTRSDLVGEDAGSMAATKAATLLLKNLHKSTDESGADPSLLDLLEERTELELGRVNQETGEQTFGGKVRLWKQLFFVGDVDADSDYRALLKYVFSFR